MNHDGPQCDQQNSLVSTLLNDVEGKLGELGYSQDRLFARIDPVLTPVSEMGTNVSAELVEALDASALALCLGRIIRRLDHAITEMDAITARVEV